jgi:hypothetical protein
MGYTHYWSFLRPSNNFEDEYINVLLDINLGLKNLDKSIVLRGGDGTGTPEFTRERICFNGDGQQGLGHETFLFNKEPDNFKFCKTNNKPYDFFVGVCLLSLANRMTGFEFSSDGDNREWEPIILFYQKFIGEIKPSILEKLLTLQDNF